MRRCFNLMKIKRPTGEPRHVSPNRSCISWRCERASKCCCRRRLYRLRRRTPEPKWRQELGFCFTSCELITSAFAWRKVTNYKREACELRGVREIESEFLQVQLGSLCAKVTKLVGRQSAKQTPTAASNFNRACARLRGRIERAIALLAQVSR